MFSHRFYNQIIFSLPFLNHLAVWSYCHLKFPQILYSPIQSHQSYLLWYRDQYNVSMWNFAKYFSLEISLGFEETFPSLSVSLFSIFSQSFNVLVGSILCEIFCLLVVSEFFHFPFLQCLPFFCCLLQSLLFLFLSLLHFLNLFPDGYLYFFFGRDNCFSVKID